MYLYLTFTGGFGINGAAELLPGYELVNIVGSIKLGLDVTGGLKYVDKDLPDDDQLILTVYSDGAYLDTKITVEVVGIPLFTGSFKYHFWDRTEMKFTRLIEN